MRRLGGLARRTGSRLLDALALRMALRPRRATAAMVTFLLFIMSMWPAEPASAITDPCSGILMSGVCGLGGIALGGPAGAIPGLIGLGDTANKTIDALNPSNLIEEWAQYMGHAVVFVLTFIERTAEQIGTPAFGQDWWLAQYAVTFGLAAILLAFMLIMITARIGAGSRSSISGIELLRQSGPRAIFVIPLISIAPGLMYALQQVADGLMQTFSSQASKQASGAVGGFIKMINQAAGTKWASLGGVFFALLLMLVVVCLGFVLLVEIAVANWGMELVGLLVPLALVAWVYPPWAKVLRRICGVLLGLMFMPAVVFFFFWTVWSALNALMAGGAGNNNNPVTIAVFMVVAIFLIDAFPLVAMWLMQMVAPSAEGLPDDVRAAAPQPSPGDVYDSTFSKGFSRMRGSGSDGDDGDDGDEDEDAGVEPGAGQDKNTSSADGGSDGADGSSGGDGKGGADDGGSGPDDGSAGPDDGGSGGGPMPGGPTGGSPADGDGGSDGGKGGGAGGAGGAGEGAGGASLGDAAAVAAV